MPSPRSTTSVTRTIRVVTLIDSLSPDNLGGAERFATVVAMKLDRERFDSVIVSTRPSEGPLVDEVRAAGIRVVDFDRSSRHDLRSWARVIAFLRRERIDVLHAHKHGSNVAGTIVGRAARVPVIVAHEHTWSYEGQRLRVLLDREIVGRGSDAFLAVSREDRRRMIEIEGVRPEKARFLPIGIATPPPPSGRDLRAELGIPGDAPVVGTVCAMRKQKALEVLVRAAAELAPAYPGLRVLIAGAGPEEEGLRALARELGVEDTVRMLGFWRPADVPDLLAALDVAVNTSDFEGSPLGVMEFMEAGVPVVATSVGGVPDLIDDGVHGLLVERRDHRGVADAIARLLRDRELAARLAEAGRERRRAEFDVDTTVRSLERLYVELLERKKS